MSKRSPIEVWQGTGNDRWYWTVLDLSQNPPRIVCSSGTHTKGFASEAKAWADVDRLARILNEFEREGE